MYSDAWSVGLIEHDNDMGAYDDQKDAKEGMVSLAGPKAREGLW